MSARVLPAAKRFEVSAPCSPAARWGVVVLISLGTIINYLSRNTLAVLAPQLEKTLHFGVVEYSYIVAAFQISYMAAQPLCGWAIDRIGVRRGFALFAVLWSGASLLHAFAVDWFSLAVCRAGLGAAEASAIPAGMKAISEWFTGPDRSKAVGWLNVGTSFGAMAAPPLTVALTLAFGWQSAFMATGLLGFAWAGLWYTLYRSPPNRPGLAHAPRAGILSVLATRRFWALAIPRFLTEPAWQTFNFWVPLYLATERHWNIQQIALFAWAPFLAADFGGVAGGYFSPWLMKLFAMKLLAARAAAVLLGAFLMIAPGCVALAGSPYFATALLCIGGFAHQVISVTINTLSADLFRSRQLAAAAGWVGSAGWLGGLLFSLTIGQVVQYTGYGPLFGCLSLFDIVGAVALIFLLRGLNPVEEAA